MIVRFGIFGNLRFLSHIETYKFLQRLLIRKKIQTVFSQGYNPRPKMSLVLPRPVGAASDDEMLVAEIADNLNDAEVTEKLKNSAVDGFKINSVQIHNCKLSFAAERAVYRFELKPSIRDEVIKRIELLMLEKNNGQSFIIDRVSEKNRKKTFNVYDFIENINFFDNTADVRVVISNDGSIRIEEILQILNITTENLANPILRTAVLWKKK